MSEFNIIPVENNETLQTEGSVVPSDGTVEAVEDINVFRRDIKDNPRKVEFAEHRVWMAKQQHEYPLPSVPYKVGVYIRFYNQTSHQNYLEYHKQKFREDVALCPRWTLVDFYVDKGAKAPRMSSSPEWCRLLADCVNGKVNLIITQLVANVSRDPEEMTTIARILAAQEPPVGIYFISEDIYTLASYYCNDMFDDQMLPENWETLPRDELDEGMIPIGPALKAGHEETADQEEKNAE